MNSIKYIFPLLVISGGFFSSRLDLNAQQLQFSPFGKNTNGSFGFNISAPLGRTYSVNTSSNLTAWNSLITNIVPSGPVFFIDTNTSQFRTRFYSGNLYWTIILPNIYPTWQITNGVDGRVLCFPSGWNTAQGVDGRMIAFPSGWQTSTGVDGRIIAFPSGWNTAQGVDGRMIAYPSGYTNKAGADGRLVALYQTGYSAEQGSDGRILTYPSAGWTTSGGPDGRGIAFPSPSFSTTNGPDGRAVAFPLTGWTTSGGLDGRRISYLSSEFSTNQGVDGRMIALPNSGWASQQGTDGRMASSPTNASTIINLDFQDQSLFAVVGTLKPVLSQTDFDNYILYLFFGTGEQQFAY